MAKAGFYNANLYRAYPLVNSDDLTEDIAIYNALSIGISDFGCIMPPGSEFDESVHTVWLHSVTKSGDDITFVFRTDADNLSGADLTFTRDSAVDPIFTTSFSTVELNEGCTDITWDGYLVTGSLTQLAAALVTTGNITTPFQVEPSQIQSLTGGVNSFNVANKDRTRSETPATCKDLCWPFTVDDYYVRDTCIVDHIRFVEGYNTCIRQEVGDNSIIINACVGGGAGDPCNLPQVTDDEDVPSFRNNIDGSLLCSEVIRSINGTGGPFFEIQGGNGVSITPDPINNKIIIDVKLSDLALCPDLADEDNVAPSTFDPDPCACGPEE